MAHEETRRTPGHCRTTTGSISRVTSYSRQDVLRILSISPRQLQAWERADLIAPKQTYSFQDLGKLRTVRALREEDVSASSIRHSIVAMRAVAGMDEPLLEACVVRTGTRLAFRHHGSILDPISRQLLIDFERLEQLERLGKLGRLDPMAAAGAASGQLDVDAAAEPNTSSVALDARLELPPLRLPGSPTQRNIPNLFLAAVRAEEAGEKHHAIFLYEEIMELDPNYAPAYINLGTIYFHLRQLVRAEELYRRATVADPGYVLAFFDLGNVLDELARLDESIAAYRKAVALSPRYADAHYNLALAHERKAEHRLALRHWQAYLKLDNRGPWADHARGQIRKLLSREKLSIAWRATSFIPPRKGAAPLKVV
jgi:tetratricopeptide (TPR) repeat protein